MTFTTVPTPAAKALSPRRDRSNGSAPSGFESHPVRANAAMASARKGPSPHIGPQFAGGGPITESKVSSGRHSSGSVKDSGSAGKHARPSLPGAGTSPRATVSRPSASASGPSRAIPADGMRPSRGKHASPRAAGTNPYNQGNPSAGKHRKSPNAGSEDLGRHAAGYSPGKDIASVTGSTKRPEYSGKHRVGAPEAAAKSAKSASRKAKVSGALNKIDKGIKAVKGVTSGHSGKLAGHLKSYTGK